MRLKFGNLPKPRVKVQFSELARASKRKPLVAIEVGRGFLRVASFKGGKKKSLKDYAVIKLENPPWKGIAEESIDKLAHFVAEKDLKGSEALVVLSSDAVLAKSLSFPRTKKEDLKRGIEIELKRSMNVSSEEIVYDYLELKKGSSHEKHYVVSAIEKGLFLELKRGLKKAGLRPKAFVPFVASYTNIIRTFDSGDSVTGMIDIDEESTVVLFFRGERLLVMREIPVGCRDFVESLAEIFLAKGGRVSLTFEEAEGLLKRNGIPVGGDADKVDGEVPLSQVLVMLRPSLEKLVGELERSLQYLEGELPGQSVKNIFVTGSGARLKNLKGYLEKELAISFEELGIERLSKESGVQLAESEGHDLASLTAVLGCLLDRKLQLNLLRPEVNILAKSGLRRIPVGKLAIATGAIVLVVFVRGEIQVLKARRELRTVTVKLSSLEQNEAKLDAVIKEKSQKAKADIILARLESNNKRLSLVLMDLSRRLPHQTRLTGFFSERVDPENGAQTDPSLPPSWIRLEGVVDSGGGQRSEETIAAIIKELVSSPLYEKAVFRKGEAISDRRMNFTIYLKLRE